MFKSLIFVLLICCVSLSGMAQKAVIIKGKEATLKDKRTRYTFVLDATHKYISAYDEKGKLRWKSSADFCNYDDAIQPYEIISMELKKSGETEKHEAERYVLYVTQCICWGFFDLKTGRYNIRGCD